MALQPSQRMLRVSQTLNTYYRTVHSDIHIFVGVPTKSYRSYHSLRPQRYPRCPSERIFPLRNFRQHSTRGPHSKATDSSEGDFVYKLAAGYVGKADRFNPSKNHFLFDSEDGAFWLEDKLSSAQEAHDTHLASGQDACFVSTVGKSNAVAFGVADGVGGWLDQGIDSADFAHGLCNYMAQTAHDFPQGMSDKMNKKHMNPLDLLQTGYNLVCADEKIIGGGSTACLAVAGADGNMTVANLGDSGFVQLRLNAVHHFSNPQTHAFNTPFQLSRVPPKILAQIEAFGGGTPFSDMPGDASITHHELRHGDVLIFGTDGVWDNMSPQDILGDVSFLMRDRGAWVEGGDGATKISKKLLDLTAGRGTKPGQVSPKQAKELQRALALTITRQAKAHSLNAKRDGPFAKAVHQAFPHEEFHGGKADDIAVVVAIAIDRKQIKSSSTKA